MRSDSPIAVFLLLFTIASTPAFGAGVGRLNGPGITIIYDAPLEKAAKALAGAYPKIRADLEMRLGEKVGFVPDVMLIRKNSEFRRNVKSDLVTAYAVPGQDLIVIDYSKMERTPFDIEATFEHELCHLLLHQMIRSSDIPLWLDEGVAQWTSGGIADIINPGEKDILKQAVLSESLIPLRDLASGFPDQQRGVLLAYEESRSFIEFVVNEFGRDKLRAVLEEMGNGIPLERAVADALSVDLNRVEEKWRGSLLRKYSWPAYVSDHIYWLLFFAAALATLAGYLKFRWKMKHYRDEGDDDDQDNPPESL